MITKLIYSLPGHFYHYNTDINILSYKMRKNISVQILIK